MVAPLGVCNTPLRKAFVNKQFLSQASCYVGQSLAMTVFIVKNRWRQYNSSRSTKDRILQEPLLINNFLTDDALDSLQ